MYKLKLVRNFSFILLKFPSNKGFVLIYFYFFDHKNGHLEPKNLGKEAEQHRNQAKFDLYCFQRFGNRFGSAEGSVPYFCTIFNTGFPNNDPFWVNF